MVIDHLQIINIPIFGFKQLSEVLGLIHKQPRQHEADQRDGVFRFIETHLKDQPRPQPTDQRFRWLARLASLCFKFGLSNLASRYLFIIIIG